VVTGGNTVAAPVTPVVLPPAQSKEETMWAEEASWYTTWVILGVLICFFGRRGLDSFG
jgi:hypothetical protein